MFVQRDGAGKIVGAFANRQDYATEWLADNDQGLAAFLNPPAPVILSFHDFLVLFTSAEQTAIVGSSDVQLKIWLLKAAGAGEITLGSAQVKQGLDYLVSLGLITTARETQILANTPPT